jgi:glycosyltransferase involved in cell wall biosynthesis
MQQEETKRRLVRVASDDIDDAAKLRVLMISASGALGGAERSLVELAAALPKDRFLPSICVPPDSQLERHCSLVKMQIHTVHLRRFRRTTNPFVLAGQVRALYQGSRTIAELCKQKQIDLLHGNTDNAALLAWEVSRITRIPFVWHCRDLIRLHGFARILGNAAAAVIAISSAVEQHLLKEGVPREKLHRIDNGIDLTRIVAPADRAGARARVRAKLGIENDRPVLLCVGAYVPWKKHEKFLDMLAEFKSRIPPVLGLLAGSGQVNKSDVYGKALRAHARELKLDTSLLQFMNERDDVPDLMAAADVLVSCSENEPFGRVVAEAGAAGLPVVSTRSGGKMEIIEDDKTGFLVKPGDVEALTTACTKLLADPKMRQQFGDAARERVEKMYNIQNTAAKVAALLESIPIKKT